MELEIPVNVEELIHKGESELEFWNAGALPLALTTDMLFTEHDSIPRNQKIAEAFFYMGLIEQWGSGTTRIAKELKAAKHPLPQFKSEAGRFRLYFYRDKPVENLLMKVSLTERQLKAVEYVEQHGSITNYHYREITGLSRETATRELKKLVIANIFVQDGAGHATKYKLKN